MLNDKTFKVVIGSAPLVSIDILLKQRNKVLLGRRVNKPARGFFFSTGGRVRKNETLAHAMRRIAKDELNIKLTTNPKFVGIFEHFYNDSIYRGVSTHYVNIAYEYETQDNLQLPTEQHSEYRWFTCEDLLDSAEVHKYVKDYFRG